MQYTVDFNANDFPAWGQAREILDRILEEGKGEELENYLENIFLEEMPSDVAINDLLTYEWETIYKDLGISDKDEDEDEEDSYDKEKVDRLGFIDLYEDK